jgi:hypothetical protein
MTCSDDTSTCTRQAGRCPHAPSSTLQWGKTTRQACSEGEDIVSNYYADDMASVFQVVLRRRVLGNVLFLSTTILYHCPNCAYMESAYFYYIRTCQLHYIICAWTCSTMVGQSSRTLLTRVQILMLASFPGFPEFTGFVR